MRFIPLPTGFTASYMLGLAGLEVLSHEHALKMVPCLIPMRFQKSKNRGGPSCKTVLPGPLAKNF